MKKEEVETLAELARLKLTEEEKEKYADELSGILEYVAQVQEVADSEGKVADYQELDVKNVLREDGSPHKPGVFSQEILEQAPDSKDGFIKVKKIIGNE